MNDDFKKSMEEQAREAQARFADAMREGEKLRENLMDQARQSADLTHQQTKNALDSLEAAMKSGSDFVTRFLRKDK